MFLNKLNYSICTLKYSKFGYFEYINLHLHTKAMSTKSVNSDVLYDVINKKGILTLNRPNRLNSLNTPAVSILLEKLIEWENTVDLVIIKGEGRAFCAGGDVLSVTNKNAKEGKQFFRTEYTMNGILGQYPVPVVSLIDGITMGGGVGLAVHGQVRIATERTLFAMPETLIGLFPDVGVSYKLARMPNHLGHYLGLTGCRLQSTDVVKSGIATHYIKSENIPKLFKGLIELSDPKKDLNNFLLCNTEDVKNKDFSLNPYLDSIERAFSAPCVEEIISRLKSDGSEFALNTLKTLKQMSPISLKISKRVIDMYKDLTFVECITIDNRLSAAALDAKVSSDLFEGVRALLVDKDRNPKWNPATLEEVTDDMVKKAFCELPPEEELNFTERVNQMRNVLSKL